MSKVLSPLAAAMHAIADRTSKLAQDTVSYFDDANDMWSESNQRQRLIAIAEELEKVSRVLENNKRQLMEYNLSCKKTNDEPIPHHVIVSVSLTLLRVRNRLDGIASSQHVGQHDEWVNGVRIVDDEPKQLLQVFFSKAPSTYICSALRANGFRWRHELGAWEQARSPQSLKAIRELVSGCALY